MERVRKTFFDPLAGSKAQIRELLATLPVGSAHPYSPQKLLLCHTQDGIDEIDVSSYPEDFFFNSVDLGEMGEILLRRMAGFPSHLQVFQDFQIQQAPASTFRVPIVSDQITILAVSERKPTYWDFCFADANYNACCWLERNTFPGITHSGDLLQGNDLLDYVKINETRLTDREICVFISGWQITQITKFLGTYPALMVADHIDKVLYIVPVPLDAATIGDATICCPLVIKRDGDGLICSILPTATTDRGMMCCSNRIESPCFPEAIRRADFTIAPRRLTLDREPESYTRTDPDTSDRGLLNAFPANQRAAFVTHRVTIPNFVTADQTIRFSTGLEFELPNTPLPKHETPTTVVLPCIFGARLEGPLLLATGTAPSNSPFKDEHAIIEYYKSLKSATVIVDDSMTDNARNLASYYRLNALFIVQSQPSEIPSTRQGVETFLNSVNVNAVTALAGPQSLILVELAERCYFYRGLANPEHINPSKLVFGADVTDDIHAAGVDDILDPRVTRIVNLQDENDVIFPSTGQTVSHKHLKQMFENLPVENISALKDDMTAVIPQLQVLLDQKELLELSRDLVNVLSTKVAQATAPSRTEYVQFLNQEYNAQDPESVKRKNRLLSLLKKKAKTLQAGLESVITDLTTMISTRTTSKRTHDLKRLARQAQIQTNVLASENMTFDTLAGYLETHASSMGVMLLNIDTIPYSQLLDKLKSGPIDASNCCSLDNRILHLEGFDAGIIMEQSQSTHTGPLSSLEGPSKPILALPYLNQRAGTGSMLAWVCWDEFVELANPFSIRWMEKCNDAHIATLRIMMRSTLSQAIASREHNFQPGSPEIGQLMSALLTAAMYKLAALRTTAPLEQAEAEDTSTKLMRGLFGNLLTMAGSGVRPMSMVWQLFGLMPQLDVPTSAVEWAWYENVVRLYPYCGWPAGNLFNNLEKLLDKMIIRVVTKGEALTSELKVDRMAQLVKFCKLKNIQLLHSRTMITVLMRVITAGQGDSIAATAGRLLKHLPKTLERQTTGYTMMVEYLEQLSQGGDRVVASDLNIANIYVTRSAAFAEVKQNASDACKKNDWVAAKEACEALLDKRAATAVLWQVPVEKLKVQNLKPYQTVLDADLESGDESTWHKVAEATRQIVSDAEKTRVPWQVGKPGQFGNDIEPLDESFVHEMLTGQDVDVIEPEANEKSRNDPKTKAIVPVADTRTLGLLRYKPHLSPAFVRKIENVQSPEDVCAVLKITNSAMQLFAMTLSPGFVWEELVENFQKTMVFLLENRSNRDSSRPTRRMLNLAGRRELAQVEDK